MTMLRAVLGGLTLLVMSACGPSVTEPDGTGAWSICEKFVTDQLASPSTAKFSPYGETQITKRSDTSWQVRGWVDAQTRSGGLIRADYDCVVRYTGRSGSQQNWISELVSVTPR